jgi:lipoprotein NlpD
VTTRTPGVFNWQGAVLSCVLICAGCESTPVAAPVQEHSPILRNPVRTPPAPRPDAKPKPPQPNVKEKIVVVRQPVDSPGTSESSQSEKPLVKPYANGDWRPEFYVVKKGDTLYSIALDHGLDYKELAAWNQIEDPSKISIDQRIRLFSPGSPADGARKDAIPLAEPTPVAPAPVKSEPRARKLAYSDQAFAQLKQPSGAVSSPAMAAAPTPTPTEKSVQPLPKPVAGPSVGVAQITVPRPTTSAGKIVWEWPTDGKVLYSFGLGTNQKGMGIEGNVGQSITAAAPGKVVYSGSGLRGYGKLIIIKHNDSYLSVYAHGSQILVKEGQSVAKGQKIAEMGRADGEQAAVLHFEIRLLGKPIDPVEVLPPRGT